MSVHTQVPQVVIPVALADRLFFYLQDRGQAAAQLARDLQEAPAFTPPVTEGGADEPMG